MRSFASDNNSGVHPRVMDAIIKAMIIMRLDMVMILGQRPLRVRYKKCSARMLLLFRV